MPTLFRFEGLRIVIYTLDHRPAHVHVLGSDGEAVYHLNCPAGPPGLRESAGFSTSDLRRISRVVADRLTALCEQWSAIHGTF